MRPARGAGPPAFRRLCLTAACVFSLGGCVPPALSLAGAALSVANDTPSTAALPGPFTGGPSTVQNSHQGDPAISEALAQAEQRQVTDECTAKLPPAAPAPLPGCAVRPVCLPGSSAPLRLRVCSHTPDTDIPDTDIPDPGFRREPGWKWAKGQSGVGVSGDTATTTGAKTSGAKTTSAKTSGKEIAGVR